MSEAHRTALEPERQAILVPVVLSFFGHLLVITVFFIGSIALDLLARWTKPVEDPPQHIEVALVSLPKSVRAMPEKATRAPRKQGNPKPVPSVARNPSDLVHHDDVVEEEVGTSDPSIDDLLADLDVAEALASLDAAPLGRSDRSATSADSEATETFSGVGANADPILVRYRQRIESIFRKNFNPLRSVVDQNPGISAEVAVQIDTVTGRVLGFTMTRSSGNPSYDAAAERAVRAVSEVPPPPEKYRHLFESGFAVLYEPER